jgi:hypothetical protein
MEEFLNEGLPSVVFGFAVGIFVIAMSFVATLRIDRLVWRVESRLDRRIDEENRRLREHIARLERRLDAARTSH